MTSQSFKHRIVRDLAWVIASPPLISGIKDNINWLDHKKCTEEFNACLNTLIELDKNPTPLIVHIDSLKSKRLGYRFEAFISYWLQISPNFELLAQNIQIIENKRTLGEVDFIIKDKHTLKVIHLEVAVKFYLGTEPFEDSFRWFGTNTQDQLGRKQQHLTNHQTQLSLKHPELLKFDIDERYCLLKGRLFYPFGLNAPPKTVIDNHLRGRWIKQCDIQNKVSLRNKDLFQLTKHEWLSELYHQEINDKVALENVYEADRAQCCIAVDRDEAGFYKETERVFILPDSFRFPDFYHEG